MADRSWHRRVIWCGLPVPRVAEDNTLLLRLETGNIGFVTSLTRRDGCRFLALLVSSCVSRGLLSFESFFVLRGEKYRFCNVLDPERWLPVPWFLTLFSCVSPVS
ncbi:hypothetical protein E2C01_006135 [Portunus trituberculatus]|uniref:Uncharacterized protein n=1 Tax=Portunus trituberculatus TaxID=210409 RepID=A0A5B7CUG7_PORTR|nr:hypothetical protein [Portunus trituberculatus]